MSLQSILKLLVVGSTGLAGDPAIRDDADSQGIQWGDCGFEVFNSIQCGSLDVPRDYTDDSEGTLQLSLAKVAAVNEPPMGTILVSFGGPGNDATEMLGRFAELLLNMTGGHHDLVGFDPRGVRKTLPLSCFGTERERTQFAEDYPSIVSDQFDDSLNQLWERAGALADACSHKAQNADLVGTAFVARDMMRVVDALGEDGLLRYYGLSYGTLLGATAMAMFPDRVESVLLDGVINSKQYYHGFQIDADGLLGVENAWNSYLEECITAGDKCALSHLNATASDLANTLSRTADRYRTPVTAGSSKLTYSAVKTLYYITLQSPESASELTTLLANLVTGENLVHVVDYLTSLDEGGGSEAEWGIACGDTIPRTDDVEGLMDEVDYLMESSPEFGGLAPEFSMICARWPFSAKEVKTVDKEVETRKPVLFVGNTYDPATPVHSAYNMTELFPGSVVVEQKGYGHCSISQPSACTWKYISQYFINGTLPDGNVECEIDGTLFP